GFVLERSRARDTGAAVGPGTMGRYPAPLARQPRSAPGASARPARGRRDAVSLPSGIGQRRHALVVLGFAAGVRLAVRLDVRAAPVWGAAPEGATPHIAPAAAARAR